ncbi:MAG: GNAT family N-acetyltransferase [Clostridia bacterium]|nr:GNAT family N-acetyltransferase [Clostridia bacterium]
MSTNKDIVISTKVTTDQKLLAIRACDSAFTISVINRPNFEELFQKIDTLAEFVIVTSDKSPIGYAAMYANDLVTKEAFITLIGVNSDYQGEHIGSRLMDNCILLARKNGMNIVRLEVLDVDKGAQAFYRKQGFWEDGRCSRESIYMKKVL